MLLWLYQNKKGQFMMAIGERIRFFRNLRGMTQKYLGTVVGFPEKTADIRMAQYESGTRTPKADLTNKLAEVFGISPDALCVPDIDSYIGLMHTLFTLEDIYGLTIEKRDGEIIMRVDPFNSREAQNLLDELHVWCAEREKYRNGEISKDDYDKWRYNYPKYNNTSNHIKVPSQELSDVLIEALNN
jgi:transcriptional regulator with XRE-family HTH domain